MTPYVYPVPEGASSMEHSRRLELARLSLEGLSLGDAFGEQFFIDPGKIESLIAARELPTGTWRVTDDTIMACALYETLHSRSELIQDHFVRVLCRNYQADPARGYGGGAHRILQRVLGDGNWHRHSTSLFRGEGSFGNGAAMRVSPLGAYFFDDLDRLVVEANKSALVTHSHRDGKAGAIAIALASALAVQSKGDPDRFRSSLYETCLSLTPESHVRDAIDRARSTPADSSVHLAVKRLGNGCEISAVDTVPFCLWAIHRCIDSFEEAMWTTVSALGDRDTTCAIVGGVVALFLGSSGLPVTWISHREPIDTWVPA